MAYYKGHSVPECFSDWSAGDPECEACTAEAMCIESQDSSSRRKQYGSVPVKSTPPQPPAPRPSSGQLLGAAPTREEIIPREGEHWMTRLGKNVASGALSAAGTEVAYFFKYWRFD